MDRFELVEKLVKSTGVSYEDAKTALESSGWDLLDAAVWLEKNGKVETKTGHFTTNPEQQQAQKEEKEKQEEQAYREAPRGSAASGRSSGNRVFHTIFSKARGIIMDNELVICKQSGEIFLEIPVWLAIVLLIVAFWPTVIVLVLVFILGFRFRFHGPDLGGETVNKVLNRMENSAGEAIDRIKSSLNNKNDYRGSSDRNEDVIDYKDPDRKE